MKIRMAKVQLMDILFEREKYRMIKYYMDRQKKNRKFKTVVLNLQRIDPENKSKILSYYFTNVIGGKNMKDSIYYTAMIMMKRQLPETEGYGMLSKE